MTEESAHHTATRRTVLKGGAAAAALAAGGSLTQRASAAPAGRTSAAATTQQSGGAPTSPTPFGEPSASIAEPGASITAVRGDRAAGWSEQTRSEVLARNGVVATSQSLAAEAGVRVLQDGGNSADAAVATAAMLGLVEPYSTGIGGDAFVIHYSADQRKLYGLNASGWSPRAWSPQYFADRGHTAKNGMPLYGPNSVTVPGAVDGWSELLDRFGNQTFATVLQPAVDLAEEGFAVTERIHHDWAEETDLLRKDPDSAATYLENGEPPALYSIFRNPDLARAYRELQTLGRDAFYTGDIGRAVVAKIQRLGGAMTQDDVSDFHAEWVDPLSVDYYGYEVHEMPPNSQGFATLILLNILEKVEPVLGKSLRDLGPRSPLFWHILIEAKKLAYDELNRYNGDPRFVDIPLGMLLSKSFAERLCRRIDLDHAMKPKEPGAVNSGTVYLTTADRWGNMTSFIYSNYQHFGSGITVPGYGFALQDRGALFNLDTDSPNVVAGRKRPYHTIIPAFVTKDDRPVLSFGNMGGSEQPQAQATELVNMINLGMNAQAATDAARFHHDQFENTLELEPQLDQLVGSALAAKGHDLLPPDSSSMGGYQAIHFTPEQAGDWPSGTGANGPVNGVYRAASDHRKDGSAIGW